ncbi:DUF6585 family protein [Pseudonocardia acaciae]|uniref:DUF6585 family protein n=1 Tax=Pseudonocardia acaciae TaxID=551276 RepID=UPI00048CA5B1|nr:DUF6585 family protein [Pseudonocardia acaciae]
MTPQSLGQYRSRWVGASRWDTVVYTLGGLLVGAVLMFALVLAGFYGDDHGLFLRILVPEFLVVVLLGAAAVAAQRSRAPQVRLYDGGLVYRAGRRAPETACPWREVSVTGGPFGQFAMRLPDGTSVSLRPRPFRLAARLRLCAEIERKMVEARLPEALRAVRGGARLEFGALGVDRHGLTLGADTLAWSEVAVDTDAARPVIEADRGRLDWPEPDAATIPDLALFMALVDALRPATPPNPGSPARPHRTSPACSPRPR